MFVFSNLATSLDGKIATADREHFPLGTPEDRREMLRLRRRADAVLMGATTLRTYRGPLLAGPGLKHQPLNVIVSSALDGISPKWRFFTDPRVQRVLFVSHRAKAATLRRFERTSAVVVLSRRLPVAEQIVEELAERGVERLLVEGGGTVMWDFARRDLIDEYHVTLTPWVLGGTEAPTLVDGEGFTPATAQKLKLKSCRNKNGELYLVYSRS